MKYVQPGEQIECSKSEVISKKIKPNSLRKIPKIGRCRIYKCSRTSSAEIIKELNPKKWKICGDSFLNEGDILESDDIRVTVNNTRIIRTEIIGGHSGTHKAQKMSTKDFTHAKITKPFKHIMDSIENRRKLSKG